MRAVPITFLSCLLVLFSLAGPLPIRSGAESPHSAWCMPCGATAPSTFPSWEKQACAGRLPREAQLQVSVAAALGVARLRGGMVRGVTKPVRGRGRPRGRGGGESDRPLQVGGPLALSHLFSLTNLVTSGPFQLQSWCSRTANPACLLEDSPSIRVMQAIMNLY